MAIFLTFLWDPWMGGVEQLPPPDLSVRSQATCREVRRKVILERSPMGISMVVKMLVNVGGILWFHVSLTGFQRISTDLIVIWWYLMGVLIGGFWDDMGLQWDFEGISGWEYQGISHPPCESCAFTSPRSGSKNLVIPSGHQTWRAGKSKTKP